jgi:hypothetical protein
MVRCIDCGFLAHREPVGGQSWREYDPNIGHAKQFVVCYRQEQTKVDLPRLDDYASVLDRNCREFYKRVPGLSPEEHLERRETEASRRKGWRRWLRGWQR